MAKVREALQDAGLNHAEYCGHIFRSRAATTAAAKGHVRAMSPDSPAEETP